jgi:hypothetical protein
MSAPHRISWWAYAWGMEGPKELMPAKPYMKAREGWRSWEATCSCGWQTRTGGALKTYVGRQVRRHKIEEAD